MPNATLTIDTSPQEFEVAIYEEKGGQWVVGTPHHPKQRLTAKVQPIAGTHMEWPNRVREDTVTWKLHPERPDVSVHFQFPPRLFKKAPGVLSTDMVAKIDGKRRTLSLKLDKKADRRSQPYYYSVWIQLQDGTGQYAKGHTPPEINVGP